MLRQLRACLSYALARRLFHWSWWVRQPRGWRWLEGQFARMANLGDVGAQSFYGHILLFRGQGLGARDEGLRLLRLAAHGGDGKAAYQLGVLSLAGDARQAPDARQAARWWTLASAAGHPLATRRLADLYRDGAPGLPADTEAAARLAARAQALGL
ncbi:sel1 repeat family protein [Pseudomonas benzenivorans]|uniref:Sel1 repeat family protein n=1 Tax=Pseudomonas benzenivorans TaxID=556533 RepID=A0ABY5HB29_9PSED|nr:sel1 repeat family protein [Pseudomonas benzenivorans]UTW08584.1 sel1 repeat family protein [Pseudomonas benzenivorans]